MRGSSPCSRVKTLIRNAWDDGYPCLLATHGPLGPNITPKGSMIVFDDTHLAWWERSKRAVLEKLSHDKRVCVMYANFKAQRDGVLDSGFLRFFGSVELHESGSVREAIFAKLLPREQTHAGAEAGIGVLIKIEKAIEFVASQLCERVAHGLRPQKISIPFQTK
ncbi:MAG: pyridoxamine 5'-phosphate oxidase family protein [Pseudolabrys sp.]